MLQQMAKIGEYAEHIDEISDSPAGDFEQTLDSRLQQGLVLVEGLKQEI
jgi:hypothetical protein